VFFQSIIDYQLISDRSSRGRGQRSKGDRGQWIIDNWQWIIINRSSCGHGLLFWLSGRNWPGNHPRMGSGTN